jgi:hypothetical protein
MAKFLSSQIEYEADDGFIYRKQSNTLDELFKLLVQELHLIDSIKYTVIVKSDVRQEISVE